MEQVWKALGWAAVILVMAFIGSKTGMSDGTMIAMIAGMSGAVVAGRNARRCGSFGRA
ncbi:hypothetical protein [Erythrobacter sp. HKB08]|uniref:hypothetical protein n=1 Tax=Erythrobacter sp. HKB08 TaxID=2502843 RepID=UPI0013E8F2BE|nr:hypothetical protein [Erythrobacter sp. HKB08]